MIGLARAGEFRAATGVAEFTAESSVTRPAKASLVDGDIHRP